MIFSSPTAPAPAATNDDAATTTSTTMNSSGSTARSNNSCVGAGDVDADKEEMVPPRLAPMLVSFTTLTISTSGVSASCPEAGGGANEEGEDKTHNIVIKGHEQEEEPAEHNHQDAGHHHAISLCSYHSSPLVMNSFPIQQQQSYSTALALPLGIQIVPQPVEALKDEDDGKDNIPNDNCVNLPPGASDEFYFPNTLHLAALPSGSTPAEENTATQDDVLTSRHQDKQEMHCWKFNITSCRNAIVTILTIAFFIMIIVMISPYIFVFLLIFACLFSVILL